MSRQGEGAVKIRAYQRCDDEQIVRLFYETVHTVNCRDYTAAQLDAWAPYGLDAADWCDPLRNSVALVAERGTTMVGFGNLLPGGELDRLYVHRNFQGQGVARELLHALEQAASQQGEHEIHVYASITARPFFLAQGYTVICENKIVRRGQTLTNFTMGKRL